MIDKEKAEIALRLAIDSAAESCGADYIIERAKNFYDFMIGTHEIFNEKVDSEQN